MKSQDTLSSLMEFASTLNSCLNTEEVRQKSMSLTCEILQSDAATLYLLDPDTNEIYFEAVVGPASRQELKSLRLKIDNKSIAGYVALKREPLIVNDVTKDRRHFKVADSRSQFETRNMVVSPVACKGHLVGVLQVINRKRGKFTEKDAHLLQLLCHQVAIAIENARLYENLKSLFVETVSSLASAIDAKDPYTGGHTKRVAFFSVMIAKHLGYTKDELDQVKIAALLHDIGKIGIDDKVLKKEAPLEKEEWEHMKLHPDKGYRILAHLKQLKYATDGMRYHHERPDGLGYPLGLKGEQIPMIARIISVADTFDAMTSNRPYRKGLSYETAYEEIVRHRGTQFDEKVVDAFIKAFNMERMGKKRISPELTA